jgi:predicted NUDIX family NTP pyrophosphohydrolase
MKQSAGILLYRHLGRELQVFLVHPGGPFWRNKDLGSWSIPKGEFMNGEEAIQAAVREFKEETGATVGGNFIVLTPVKQKGGKVIYAWALEGNIDAATIISNTFDVEWPPGSGKKQSFPEVDKADWFSVEDARLKINGAQGMLLDELVKLKSL